MATGFARGEAAGGRRVRPLFLAGVVGIAWFAWEQGGMIPPDAPDWAVPVVMGTRLLADIVGGWVVVSALRIVIHVVRQLWDGLVAGPDRGMS